ncbi:MAG TPA: head GIN domain-containing protein [Fibrobacteria bacterium]|nr:head GIN domain-containing protein [Fibrobacteria bacterium]
MKTWLTLATLPFLLSSCMVVDFQWEQGNGISATEIRSLPSFDRVRLDAPLHVIVKTGPAYSAYVTSDANLTGYFQTDAYGGTLTISMASGIQPTVEPEITLIVPELRSLTHNGGGLVEIQEDGNFPDVALTVNGNGEIRYSGTASRLKASLYGSGRIAMEGYAALLEAELYGSGEIHGENLLSGDADVASSGSGFVFLDLDYESVLNLDLSGPGRVEWWGSPSRLIYNLTGSGKVVEHRGLPKKTAGAKTAAAKQAAGAGKPYDIVTGEK